jgi:hypothetical protein
MIRPGVVRGLALMAALVSAAGVASADDEGHIMGVSAGYSTRFEEAVVSVDFLVGINRSFAAVPTGSFLKAGGVHRWTAGLELQWHPPIASLHPKLLGWVGGGLGILIEDPEGPQDPTTRDLLLNTVAGVGWEAPATPFIQVRVTLTDPVDVGLAIGVRF